MVSTLERYENVELAQCSNGPPFQLPFSSFADFFSQRVTDPRIANHTFLTYYDDNGAIRSYTYAEFGTLVGRTLTYMHEHLGIRRGDRIVTILFNHDGAVVIYFAAWVLGAAVVPINIDEPETRKLYILQHSEARALFCWEKGLEEIQGFRNQLPHLRSVVSLGDGETPLEEIMGNPRPSLPEEKGSLRDDALIVYTSGTTGPPKGVVLTAENILINSDGISNWHELGTGDSLMCVLPIHHVNGIIVTLITPFYVKGTAVLNRRFHSSAFWSRVQDQGVTCVSVVPTILEFLLEGKADATGYHLDHFRGVICGAGPLLKETAYRFEDRFHFPIRHGYGLSETTCYSSFVPINLSGHERRYWLTNFDYPSVGVPILHNEMAILDDQGQPLPQTEKGEICIRGRNVCSGYLKRPDANEESFQWGWFRSGDEGFFVHDAKSRPFFFISGRLKELIIRGGVNISPLEIDEVLKGHHSVKFAMAVPFEHRYYGEEIAAYITIKEDQQRPSESDILEFCRKKMPFSKCPKVIVYGEEVPYTTTGKPKRLALKAQLSPLLAKHRDVKFQDIQPQLEEKKG